MSEIRALAERVKELRQELESVEARLRELSLGEGDAAPLAPIETIDSPTVLTTDHAQRRARADRMMPMVAAAFAVVVLAGGIGIGYVLSSPARVSTPATATATVSASEPALVAAPIATPSPPAPAEISSASPPAPSATVPTTLPGTATAAVASPIAPSAIVPPSRRSNVDRGF